MTQHTSLKAATYDLSYENRTQCRTRRLRGVCAALGVLLSGCATSMVRGGGPVIDGPGRPLPAVGTMTRANRADFTAMIAGARGHPIVVNVWASWCPPCRAEAPLLARAARTYAGRVAFLGVVSRDDPAAASRFVTRYGLDYPNVVDSGDVIAPFLGVRGLPTTFIFGSDGRLRVSVSGGISEQRLAAQISDALGDA